MPLVQLHLWSAAMTSTPPPSAVCPAAPQIVYEFLLRYVVSSDTDAKVAKKHIDQNFVVHLLDLFDSGAPPRCAAHAVVGLASVAWIEDAVLALLLCGPALGLSYIAGCCYQAAVHQAARPLAVGCLQRTLASATTSKPSSTASTVRGALAALGLCCAAMAADCRRATWPACTVACAA